MESSKGINLGKKNKMLNAVDSSHGEYEKYKEENKKLNQKELIIFFLNELIGEYGYEAVFESLKNMSSNKQPQNKIDCTMDILLKKFGNEIIQENIGYYKNIDVKEYKNIE